MTQSCLVTVDLRAGLQSVVADILPDVVPSISPSSLPVIAGKVTDDILSGGASYDAVPSRAEVSCLVQARMVMIKGLIKEGRQPRSLLQWPRSFQRVQALIKLQVSQPLRLALTLLVQAGRGHQPLPSRRQGPELLPVTKLARPVALPQGLMLPYG